MRKNRKIVYEKKSLQLPASSIAKYQATPIVLVLVHYIRCPYIEEEDSVTVHATPAAVPRQSSLLLDPVHPSPAELVHWLAFPVDTVRHPASPVDVVPRLAFLVDAGLHLASRAGREGRREGWGRG